MGDRVRSGQIITFYSYKGGTGRSMTLANVACLLARTQTPNRPVLVVDWDLEAPGLHRYFANQFTGVLGSNASRDSLDRAPGLIDLFLEIQELGNSSSPGAVDDRAEEIVRAVAPERFVLETDIPSLHFLKAGTFDTSYPRLVNGFDWVGLFQNCRGLFAAFADYLAERYSYVLIDSRTGHTDIGGICTTLLPERLVAVFTPNRQSLYGLLEVVGNATEYRRQSGDPRPLLIFPLPSRIETAEPKLWEKWRLGTPEDDTPGYQSLFEGLFRKIYGLSTCDLRDYFNEIQIQHVPRLAYGEEISVLTETDSERLSLRRSYEAFTDWLVHLAAPWERPVKEEEKLKKSVSRVEESLRNALATQVESLGPDHPEVADTLVALADVMLADGRSEEAEPLLQRALEIRKASLGAGHQKVVEIEEQISDRNGPRRAERLDSSARVTVVFTDVSGSSSLYATRGDEVAFSLIADCMEVLVEELTKHRGRVVKRLGDGILSVFEGPASALSAAVAMRRALDDQERFKSVGLRIRSGISTGRAVMQQGDVFGDVVNVAARLVSTAGADEILLSAAAYEGLPPASRSSTQQIAELAMRGRSATVLVYQYVSEQSEPDRTAAPLGSTGVAELVSSLRLELTLGEKLFIVSAERPNLTIGRAVVNDISIEAEVLSRYHAQISLRGGKFMLTDRSTNGTYVQSDDGRVVRVNREEIELRGCGRIDFATTVPPILFRVATSAGASTNEPTATDSAQTTSTRRL